jgi:hypothetical protein
MLIKVWQGQDDETTGLLPPTIDPPMYESTVAGRYESYMPLCKQPSLHGHRTSGSLLCQRTDGGHRTNKTKVHPTLPPIPTSRSSSFVHFSKMVNVLSATPSYLNDTGFPTSRSNGSISRTRERPVRTTSSRSPPPSSTRSDSSTSLIRNNSNLQVPYNSNGNNNNTANHHLRNIRIIKGGLRALERGRSQTLKRRTIDPELNAEPPEQGVTDTENVANEDAGEASSAATSLPNGSQESISAAVSLI